MAVEGEFQSQPFLTIPHTNNGERLEGLRCCELPANQSVHTQSDGRKKWMWAKPNLYPLATRN